MEAGRTGVTTTELSLALASPNRSNIIDRNATADRVGISCVRLRSPLGFEGRWSDEDTSASERILKTVRRDCRIQIGADVGCSHGDSGTEGFVTSL